MRAEHVHHVEPVRHFVFDVELGAQEIVPLRSRSSRCRSRSRPAAADRGDGRPAADRFPGAALCSPGSASISSSKSCASSTAAANSSRPSRHSQRRITSSDASSKKLGLVVCRKFSASCTRPARPATRGRRAAAPSRPASRASCGNSERPGRRRRPAPAAGRPAAGNASGPPCASSTISGTRAARQTSTTSRQIARQAVVAGPRQQHRRRPRIAYRALPPASPATRPAHRTRAAHRAA